ncbi:lecithin retinol acyltransferase family protein [Asticcacaulis biprosthecium]|uniref:lecithin retinol acyltransferase family protein n=1 Tax=Asticcacaulis biprosthecium TaxID=76891 RepID=UPI00058DC530|nr:lecithin retinol acyltransferase family protein [Asticcacaulis biprosthecium]
MVRRVLPLATEIVVQDEGSVIPHHALVVGYDSYGREWAMDNAKGTNVSPRPLAQITRNRPFKIVRRQPAYSPAVIVQRAWQRRGQYYSAAGYNCQHFTSDCVTGKPKSETVRNLGVLAAVALVAIAISRDE